MEEKGGGGREEGQAKTGSPYSFFFVFFLFITFYALAKDSQ